MGVFIGLVVLIVLVIASANEGGLIDFFYNRVGYHNAISRERFMEIDRILRKHSQYYAKLSRAGKARYIHRALRLVRTKKWKARKGLQLTYEMQLLIAGAATQLTFGMKRYRFSNIRTILIYPDIFKLPLLKTKIRGGVSPRGTALLSWKHLVQGYADETDKINLALHEMAHALHLELTHGTVDTNFEERIGRWFRVGTPEFKRLKAGKSSFFRAYGGTNSYEFFAVAVEHFFEASVEFAEKHPELYREMVMLLGQDPRNHKYDYRVVLAGLPRRRRRVAGAKAQRNAATRR